MPMNDGVQEWLDDTLEQMVRDFPGSEKYAFRLRGIFKQATDEAGARKGKYARHMRPVDAIEDLLKEVGTPMLVEDVKRALLDGGFQGDTNDPEDAISRCLGAYLPRETNTRTALKRPKGKEQWVGLGEWKEDRWSDL